MDQRPNIKQQGCCKARMMVCIKVTLFKCDVIKYTIFRVLNEVNLTINAKTF